jgi:hypothetical protein
MNLAEKRTTLKAPAPRAATKAKGRKPRSSKNEEQVRSTKQTHNNEPTSTQPAIGNGSTPRGF